MLGRLEGLSDGVFVGTALLLGLFDGMFEGALKSVGTELGACDKVGLLEGVDEGFVSGEFVGLVVRGKSSSDIP